MYKGRIAPQGHNVHDETNTSAVFRDNSASASLIVSGKVVNAISLLPGFAEQQADGVKDYTQALLYNSPTDDRNHIPTWIFLPEDQCLPDWHKRFSRPVILLRVALYGHPLAGDFWDRHRTTQLRKAGFQTVEGWESVYVHEPLKLVLTVYIDDFKMAGPEQNLPTGWNLSRSTSKWTKSPL